VSLMPCQSEGARILRWLVAGRSSKEVFVELVVGSARAMFSLMRPRQLGFVGVDFISLFCRALGEDTADEVVESTRARAIGPR
jgi:hypothetical protein